MRTMLATLALTIAAALAPTTALAAEPPTVAPAAAPSWLAPGMIEPPVRPVRRLAVTYTERMQVPGRSPLLYAEFNDGRVVAFRPCRYEDGSGPRERQDGCYWNARTRGNHVGTSLIHYRGRVFLLDTRTV